MKLKLIDKKITHYVLILTALLFILSSCSRSIQSNQIQFGIIAAQKGLWDEAVFRWKKVVRSSPDSAAAHNNLAVAYENKGQWEEANKEYEIALKLAPKNNYIKANFDNFKKNIVAREMDEKEKKDEKK
jgi:Tfp pilus assembly protein PilF